MPQPQFIPSPMKIIERDALFGAAIIVLLIFAWSSVW
jgi:hypothetical protein